jgi:hypothetical protein
LTDLASWWGSQLSAATILAHKKANTRDRAKPKPNTQTTSIYSPTQKTTQFLRGRPSRILLDGTKTDFPEVVGLFDAISHEKITLVMMDAAKRSIAMRRNARSRCGEKLDRDAAKAIDAESWRTVQKSKSSTSGD